MPKTTFSNEDLVRAWVECDSVEGVAARLEAKRTTVSMRASWLRKKGVRLPTKRHFELVSVDALNAIIAGLK